MPQVSLGSAHTLSASSLLEAQWNGNSEGFFLSFFEGEGRERNNSKWEGEDSVIPLRIDPWMFP